MVDMPWNAHLHSREMLWECIWKVQHVDDRQIHSLSLWSLMRLHLSVAMENSAEWIERPLSCFTKNLDGICHVNFIYCFLFSVKYANSLWKTCKRETAFGFIDRQYTVNLATLMLWVSVKLCTKQSLLLYWKKDFNKVKNIYILLIIFS